MAVKLKILNKVVFVSVNGKEYTFHQGDSTDSPDDEYDVAAEDTTSTTDGEIHLVEHALATATVVTVYDDDNDVPTDWDYMFFWADVDMYLQLVGSGTNVILKTRKKIPFVWHYDSLLAAADTTIITGASEPTLTDIDSIVVGNYTGGSGNYVFAVFD